MKALFVLAAAVVFLPLVHAAEAGRKQSWLTPSVGQTEEGLNELEEPRVLPPVATKDIRSPVANATGRVHLERIVVEGNSVLDAADVEAITGLYVGRALSDADLHALREALSNLYVQAGYLNSGVVIPDQDVSDGTLRLQAVEGGISSVRITGDPGFRGGYLEARVMARVSEPLNVYQLRDAMRLLQRDANVSGIDAHIAPGAARGSSDLSMNVTAAPPLSVFLSADNHRSEAIGAEQLNVGLAHSNLTGRGDRLYAEIGFSEGAETGSAGYRLPILANDTTLQVYYQRDQVDVIERPFEDLDISTQTDTYGLAVTVPLRDTLTNTVSVTLGGEVKRSVTELSGVRFSLSPGALNGESKVSALVLGADWVRRSAAQVLALRGTFRHGLDVLDATEAAPTAFDPSGTDAEFTTFLGQAQYLRRLTDSVQVALRATLQLADDPLLGIEKLSMGGVNTVRGYRENLLVRDNGWATSAELHWQPFHTDERAWLQTLTLVPFLDYGRSWDEEDVDLTSIARDTSDAAYVASAGLGLRWQPLRGLNLALYWAEDVADGFDSGDDPRSGKGSHGLQDDGVHFSVSYVRRF